MNAPGLKSRADPGGTTWSYDRPEQADAPRWKAVERDCKIKAFSP